MNEMLVQSLMDILPLLVGFLVSTIIVVIYIRRDVEPSARSVTIVASPMVVGALLACLPIFR